MESRHYLVCKINAPISLYYVLFFFSSWAILFGYAIFKNDYVHFLFGWVVI